nr:hypothetical protein CFP56_10677 [Quercus suber]
MWFARLGDKFWKMDGIVLMHLDNDTGVGDKLQQNKLQHRNCFNNTRQPLLQRYFHFASAYELLSQIWKPVGALRNKCCLCNRCHCTFRSIMILEWNLKNSIAFQSMNFVVTKTTGFGIGFWIYEIQFRILAALFYPQGTWVLFIGACEFPNNEAYISPQPPNNRARGQLAWCILKPASQITMAGNQEKLPWIDSSSWMTMAGRIFS